MTAWKNSCAFIKQEGRANNIEACTAFLLHKSEVCGWVRVNHKPNSVPARSYDHTGSNHLSRTTVTCRLKQPTRELTDEQSASTYVVRTTPPAWSCSEWGLPSQPVTWLLVSSYLTISPLPGMLRYSLYRCISSSSRAVCFCGTFLKVTLTGRYPASCSLEFGLSSCLVARDCLFYSNPPYLE